jgi:hypothetical protein
MAQLETPNILHPQRKGGFLPSEIDENLELGGLHGTIKAREPDLAPTPIRKLKLYHTNV